MAGRVPQLSGTAAAARWGVRLAVLVAVCTLAVASDLLPIGTARVEGTSMMPAIAPGDRVLVLHGAAPQRGRIVLATAPDGSEVVKRVVALGGDRIAMEDGVLVVDGAPVDEPYADPLGTDGEYAGPLTVPPGSVYLLGDRRGWSNDSRTFGPVASEDIRGEVLTSVGLPGQSPEDP